MTPTTRYILLGVVILALLTLFINNRGDEKKRFDWNETYIEKSKEPFGSHVIHEILKNYYPDKKLEDLKEPIAKSLPSPDSLQGAANYVFVGDGLFADTADADKLLLFVYQGNKAFIAANEVPNYLLESVFKDSCDDENERFHRFRTEWVDSAEMNFNHPQLIENKPIKYDFLVAGKKNRYDWSYIDTLRGECTEGAKNITPLGNFNGDNVNFIKVDYGRGSVFIHSNPIVFTNFHLLDTTKLRYAAKVFSHLSAGTIYWDSKSRVSREVVRKMNGSNVRLEKDGPLKYILAQPGLRWAWFIFLGLIGLYFIFGSKRRQRMIPVLEDKSNTSLDFIQTIGQMYFNQGEHIRLCDMMLKQFQTFVRERYNLASREMNSEFMELLAIKSNVSLDKIKQIVNHENLIYRNSLTESSMIDFYYLLNSFYKTCK